MPYRINNPSPLKIDLTKAKDTLVVQNYSNDTSYCPYCMRCSGLHRMQLIAPFLWKHGCGAFHDERQVIVKETVDVPN